MSLTRHLTPIAGVALNSLRQRGRGFAAQQVLEEWQSRGALSAKVSITALCLDHLLPAFAAIEQHT